MTQIISVPQTEPVAVETGEGTFLVAPDGTVLERLTTMENEEAYQDWLTDEQRDNPVLFEQRTGEGWTDAHWRERYADEVAE